MDTIVIIMAMFALILLSHVIHLIFKRVAIPLIQIALGAICAILFSSMVLDFEMDLFMLVFIAPILFMDGKKFKNKELLDFKKPILYLVLGLVLVNVIIIGYVIYFILGIPLPMAFALAAILSPTDAVAVKAIAGNIKLPHKVSAIVEGESMLNDASGLVAFNLALVAQITGVFHLRDVAVSFAYIALGGLAIGIAFALAASFLIGRLKNFGINEPYFFTLMQMLLPFVVFLIAEHFGLSGILAVVACGRVFAMLSPKLITASEANIRFISEGSWSVFLFVLNGLVFVLLGMKLPHIVHGLLADGFSLLHGLAYVVILTLLLVVLRFAWVHYFISNREKNRIKNSLMLSLSGVRGALTLAVCLSIPFVITEGEVFGERSLILFISSGVIILSLVIANVFLPIIMGKDSSKAPSKEFVSKRVLEASLESIRKARNSENNKTSNLLEIYFEYLLSDLEHKGKKGFELRLKESGDESLEEVLEIGLGQLEIEKLLEMKVLDKYELEFIAIQIQKLQIKALRAKGEVDNAMAYVLRRDISLEEAALFEDDIESVHDAHDVAVKRLIGSGSKNNQ